MSSSPGCRRLRRSLPQFGARRARCAGRLDRRRLRDRVFADPAQATSCSKSITHPAIREELARRSAAAGRPLSDPRDSAARRRRARGHLRPRPGRRLPGGRSRFAAADRRAMESMPSRRRAFSTRRPAASSACRLPTTSSSTRELCADLEQFVLDAAPRTTSCSPSRVGDSATDRRSRARSLHVELSTARHFTCQVG